MRLKDCVLNFIKNISSPVSHYQRSSWRSANVPQIQLSRDKVSRRPVRPAVYMHTFRKDLEDKTWKS